MATCSYKHFSRLLQYFHDALRASLAELVEASKAVSAGKAQSAPVMRDTLRFLDHLHGHHTIEDHAIFPFLARRMDCSKLTADHEHMDTMIDKLHAECTDTEVVDAAAKGRILCELLQELQDCMLPHLALEESMTTPERMKGLFSEAEMRQLHP